MKKMFSEFYEFISKGNVIGLAIGLMIGAAFNSIVSSLINDIFMPLLGLLTNGISFKDWFVALDGKSYASFAAAEEAGAATLNYGNFIAALINFLLIALVLFFIMKGMTKAMALRKKEEAAAAPADPSDEVKLLTEIRDALAKK